jgi:uncharacterized glyoxalase superfamily metalloenzyme YdcJ
MNVISSNELRVKFSQAMSEMYRKEVPLYGTLLDLVANVNQQVLEQQPQLKNSLKITGSLNCISEERHGAIRLGRPDELFTMRRLLSIFGMYPVAYYDLSEAGIPVHSTAFRPIETTALSMNPFRIFTSLLRTDLLTDEALRKKAESVLASREIFSPKLKAFINQAEDQKGITSNDVDSFIKEAINIFRWHDEALIDIQLYDQLCAAHRLVADVVSFKGPHINHLTPATLDIDDVQRLMPEYHIPPKAVIEGPPPRSCPILLRQTSFKALEEPVKFLHEGEYVNGSHTARFGEIEQRGIALTPKGQALYDKLLTQTREQITPNTTGSNADDYMQ